MLSEAASYVTDRVTETAVERLWPKLALGAAIVTCLLSAIAFALVALYALLGPVLGRAEAAAVIGAGCLVLALVLVLGGWAYSRARRSHQSHDGDGHATLAAVEEEAREVIDYFGTARVLATAFMFGFSAARRVKSR